MIYLRILNLTYLINNILCKEEVKHKWIFIIMSFILWFLYILSVLSSIEQNTAQTKEKTEYLYDLFKEAESAEIIVED